MTAGVKSFYVTAYYEPFDDEPELTCDELASRLRGWGFTAVDVEDES